MAAALCPKKGHWAVTDQERLTKSSGIGLQCFYFTSVSQSTAFFKLDSYLGCFHYVNKTNEEFFNNNGSFTWHIKPLPQRHPTTPPLPRPLSQGTPPMTLIEPFVEL